MKVLSHHSAAVKFEVGRTQINNIILDQQNIQQMYTEGSNAQAKYLSCRQLQYPEINDKVWRFFCEARSKNIPVNGSMLLAEANEIAIKYNYDKFSASNGAHLPNGLSISM